MGLTIRILLVLGILCLAFPMVGTVVTYLTTLQDLSENPDASVDALTDRTAEIRQGFWPSGGWTALGVILILTAVGLAILRVGRRKRLR